MRQLYLTVFISITFLINSSPEVLSQEWNAKWITSADATNSPNEWIAFKSNFKLEKHEVVFPLKIASDTKYWLWINNKMVIYEGGLKRGPTAYDTYFDYIDIAQYIDTGKNTIAILLWHFGKEGFSHKNSGKAGLIVNFPSDYSQFSTSSKWMASKLLAFQSAKNPEPNFRLAESNILFDARLELNNWQTDSNKILNKAIEIGEAGTYPWNKLIKRKIPFFKDHGTSEYVSVNGIPNNNGTKYECRLPYNSQVHPILKIRSNAAGLKINVYTNNYIFLGEPTIRGEYITKAGEQEFEFWGWMNGEKVIYEIPKGIEIIKLQYRESSYNTELEGNFISDDPTLSKLWKKGQRTLLLSMRDTYMDCPDRERAAWTGDIVSQSTQSFYSLSVSSHALAQKWLSEFTGWNKPNGEFSSPVPAGNSDLEIPDQTLLTFGPQGIWNYFLNTNDTSVLESAFPVIDRNLGFWGFDGNGLVNIRSAGNRWIWGDRSNYIDMKGLYNMLFCGVLHSMHKIALVLGNKIKSEEYQQRFEELRARIRIYMFTGIGYKSQEVGFYDERVQAFAILNEIAEITEMDNLLEIMNSQTNASPFMEQFVVHAMMKAGSIETGLNRIKKRYGPMAEDKSWTTLWEGWSIPNDEFGGTTPNHAWSGGAVYLLPMFVHGVIAISPGYKKVQIKPYLGSIKHSEITVPTTRGTIKSSFNYSPSEFHMGVSLPTDMNALVELPKQYSTYTLNGKTIIKYGLFTGEGLKYAVWDKDTSSIKIELPAGNWDFDAINNSKEINTIEMPVNSNTINQLCFNSNLILSVKSLQSKALALNAGFKGIVRWYYNDSLLLMDTVGFINPLKLGTYKAELISEKQTLIASNQITLYTIPKPVIEKTEYAFCHMSPSLPLESSPGLENRLIWFDTNMDSLGTGTPVPSTNNIGAYKYHVAQRDGFGCTSEKLEILISVKQGPKAPEGISEQYCQYQTPNPLRVTSPLGTIIKWIDSTTKQTKNDPYWPIVSTQSVGIYTFKCFSKDSSNGCSSPVSSIEVRVSPNPETPKIAYDSRELCDGDSLILSTSRNHMHQWFLNGSPLNGATKDSYAAKDSGTYSVKVTTKEGCSETSIPVKLSLIKAPDQPTITRVQDELLSNYSSNNQWFGKDGKAINGAIFQQYKPTVDGFYRVKTTQNGCSSISAEAYYYTLKPVGNLSSGEYFKILPNPTNGETSFKYLFNKTKDVFINVIDMTGKIIINNKKINSGIKLNFGSFISGKYLVHVKDKTGKPITTEKLIKN